MHSRNAPRGASGSRTAHGVASRLTTFASSCANRSTTAGRSAGTTASAFLVASLLFASSACSDDEVKRLGVVECEKYAARVQFVGPPTVHVGQTFTVSVLTVGGGCDFADETIVLREGDDAVIVPYDVHVIPGENEGCTQILKGLTHVASLRFDSPGTKTIRVRGQRADTIPPIEQGEVIDVLFTTDVN